MPDRTTLTTQAGLTAEHAARRFLKTYRPDAEECAAVRSFLRVTQPMRGVDLEGDERIEYAEHSVLRWLALSIEDNAEPAELDLRSCAYDAATLAAWLRCREPIKGESYCRGDETTVGFGLLLGLIDDLLLEPLGIR